MRFMHDWGLTTGGFVFIANTVEPVIRAAVMAVVTNLFLIGIGPGAFRPAVRTALQTVGLPGLNSIADRSQVKRLSQNAIPVKPQHSSKTITRKRIEFLAIVTLVVTVLTSQLSSLSFLRESKRLTFSRPIEMRFYTAMEHLHTSIEGQQDISVYDDVAVNNEHFSAEMDFGSSTHSAKISTHCKPAIAEGEFFFPTPPRFCRIRIQTTSSLAPYLQNERNSDRVGPSLVHDINLDFYRPLTPSLNVDADLVRRSSACEYNLGDTFVTEMYVFDNGKEVIDAYSKGLINTGSSDTSNSCLGFNSRLSLPFSDELSNPVTQEAQEIVSFVDGVMITWLVTISVIAVFVLAGFAIWNWCVSDEMSNLVAMNFMLNLLTKRCSDATTKAIVVPYWSGEKGDLHRFLVTYEDKK